MHIAKEEKINVSPQHLMLISVLARGSMRRAINCLQSLSVLDEITEPIIRELLDTTVDVEHSRKLLKRVLSTDVEQYEEELFRLVYANAFSPSEILQGIMTELIATNDPSTLRAVMILAEGDWRISQGASGMLQARCALFRINQMKDKEKIIRVMK
jgi:DNA polymerase III gamma/tau subunit